MTVARHTPVASYPEELKTPICPIETSTQTLGDRIHSILGCIMRLHFLCRRSARCSTLIVSLLFMTATLFFISMFSSFRLSFSAPAGVAERSLYVWEASPPPDKFRKIPFYPPLIDLTFSKPNCEFQGTNSNDMIYLGQPLWFTMKCDSQDFRGQMFIDLETKNGVHHYEMNKTELPPDIFRFSGFILLDSTGPHTLSITHVSVDEEIVQILHEMEYNVFDICLDRQNGYWTMEEGFYRWCSIDCLYSRFTPGNIDSIQNTRILLMGNSHMRNLFRCLADFISNGESRKFSGLETPNLLDITSNSLSSIISSTGSCKKSNQCLSCENRTPVHCRNFSYFDRNHHVMIENWWQVLWNDAPQNITKPDREYTGYRIGSKVVEEQVLPWLRKTPHAYFIFNFNGHFNPFHTIPTIISLLCPTIPNNVSQRILFIADYNTRQEVVDIFVDSCVQVLDLRWVFHSHYYINSMKPESSNTSNKNGDGESVSNDGHLKSQLHRLLIQEILTWISITQWRSAVNLGNFSIVPPVTDICSKSRFTKK